MAKNVAASVHQKLLNISREDKRPFSELLQYYAMERFLYRLSQSPHNRCFTLKGALMLWAILGPSSRPTRSMESAGRRLVFISQDDIERAALQCVLHSLQCPVNAGRRLYCRLAAASSIGSGWETKKKQ